MSKKSKRALAAILTLAAVAVGASAVYASGRGDGLASSGASPEAVALLGTCETSLVSFVTGADIVGTTSTTYADVPSMTVTFKLGGQAASCVEVQYSAEAFADNNKALFIRALLDGAVAGSPSEVQFSGDDDEDVDGRWARSHVANFLFAGVSPGTHTVTIQFRSHAGPPPAQMQDRSMFVHYS